MHMTLPEQQQAQEDFARRYPLVANRMELHKGMPTGVDNVTVADAMTPLATRNVELTLPVRINAENTVKVKAEVQYAADMDATDNATSETEVKVQEEV